MILKVQVLILMLVCKSSIVLVFGEFPVSHYHKIECDIKTKMHKTFLYCLTLFFSCVVIQFNSQKYLELDQKWNLYTNSLATGNILLIWHIRKISYRCATSDSLTSTALDRGCPHGVMVKALDCRIVVCEFVLQSRYYVHFRANTLGKGMNPLILPAMG